MESNHRVIARLQTSVSCACGWRGTYAGWKVHSAERKVIVPLRRLARWHRDR